MLEFEICSDLEFRTLNSVNMMVIVFSLIKHCTF